MTNPVKAAVAAAILSSAAALPAQAQISGDTVKIGFITDLSGFYMDNDGPGGVEAIRLALSEMGGSVNGKKIELLVADHQNKPDIAAAKAREWFDQQGVDMLIGGVNSSAALAMAKVAAEKKRVFFSIGAGSRRLTDEDCTPYTVHYVYNTTALARGTGRAILDKGGKDWYFLTADYAFGHSLEQDTTAVLKANGGSVKGIARHPLNAADFSSFMLQAQASGAKILGLANGGGDTVNSVKAAREFGLNKKMKIASLLMFIGDVHALGLEAAQGMYLTDGWYWDANNETRAWSKRFFEKTKRMPTSLQVGDYSAALQYLKAVKTTGTDDGDKIMAHLKKTPIDDIFVKGGKIRSDGRMVYDMALYEVKAPADSKYPWDYYKFVTKIPAEQAYGAIGESKCPLK